MARTLEQTVLSGQAVGRILADAGGEEKAPSSQEQLDWDSGEHLLQCPARALSGRSTAECLSRASSILVGEPPLGDKRWTAN